MPKIPTNNKHKPNSEECICMLNLVREVRVNQEDRSYKHDDNAEILLHNDLCTMFITLFSTCKVRNNLANTKILMYYATVMEGKAKSVSTGT